MADWNWTQTSYRNSSYSWNTEISGQWTNVDTKEYEMKKMRDYAKYQELMANKPVEITDEQRTKIIITLRDNRAGNGDSAFTPNSDELKIYRQLAEDNIIKTIDNKKFWIEENE